MSVFENATNDIFSNADFTDSAVFGSTVAPVIPSKTQETPALDDFGVDQGISFVLLVRKTDVTPAPKRNDLVTYHSVEYRVDSVDQDSVSLVWLVKLKSKSSR